MQNTASATADADPGVQPQRIGVCQSPPALVLDYLDLASGQKRRRIMPVKQGEANAGLSTAVTLLAARHQRFLAGVLSSQLQRLMARVGVRELAADVVDLNKCSSAAIEAAKAEMDQNFKPVKHGDPGYVYDVTKDFGVPEEQSGWSDDD